MYSYSKIFQDGDAIIEKAKEEIRKKLKAGEHINEKYKKSNTSDEDEDKRTEKEKNRYFSSHGIV